MKRFLSVLFLLSLCAALCGCSLLLVLFMFRRADQENRDQEEQGSPAQA